MPFIKEGYPEVDIYDLKKSRSFRIAEKNAAPIIAKQCVKLDVDLSIIHGTMLTLRGTDLSITENEMEFVIIGRHVLLALGLDNEKLISASAERFDVVFGCS